MKSTIRMALFLGLTLAPLPAAGEEPWEAGVVDSQKDHANALYEAGNQLFAQDALEPALDKYRAALALWSHPRIRFNLAVTLIRLDRPLEAAEELDHALRFGAKPFEKEIYQQALGYQALLKGRIGYIEARCDQQRAQIFLDGQPWFACPGAQTQRVLSGPHTVVGELRGYISDGASTVVVPGGGMIKHEVKLKPIESAVSVELQYPLPRWVPITVAITGGVIALTGAGVYLAGENQMREFDDNFSKAYPMGGSLASDPQLREQHDRAKLKGDIGLGMMIAGGAVFVGGIVMTAVNRPKRILTKIEIAPTAGGVAAATTWTF
jgi:tetratricopeptide (TPR) repeat protein